MIANTELQFLFGKAEIKEKLLQIEQFHEAFVNCTSTPGKTLMTSCPLLCYQCLVDAQLN